MEEITKDVKYIERECEWNIKTSVNESERSVKGIERGKHGENTIEVGKKQRGVCRWNSERCERNRKRSM